MSASAHLPCLGTDHGDRAWRMRHESLARETKEHALESATATTADHDQLCALAVLQQSPDWTTSHHYPGDREIRVFLLPPGQLFGQHSALLVVDRHRVDGEWVLPQRAIGEHFAPGVHRRHARASQRGFFTRERGA